MKLALSFFLISSGLSLGQASPNPAAPQTAANTSNIPKTCIVLKRMGPADAVTSHLYSFGIRGKQFQFVEGDTPQGIKFHGRLTDHDVREIQDHGGKVVILEQKYTNEDLLSARQGCQAHLTGQETEPPSNHISSAGVVAPDLLVDPKTSQVQNASSTPVVAQALLDVTSQPAGADIEIDGAFVGNTPSSLAVASGDHTIKISKKGYKDWERKIKATSGSVKIAAELEARQSQR